jgi:hypothetical protein
VLAGAVVWRSHAHATALHRGFSFCAEDHNNGANAFVPKPNEFLLHGIIRNSRKRLRIFLDQMDLGQALPSADIFEEVRSLNVQSKKTSDYNYYHHDADDVEDVHLFAPVVISA